MKNAERNAYIVILLITIPLLITSFFLIVLMDYGENWAVERANQLVAMLLNLSAGLVGSVVGYLVFRRMFGLETGNTELPLTQAPSPNSEDDMPEISYFGNKQALEMYKLPLRDALFLLAEERKLDLNSIGIFEEFKLVNGQPLLNNQDIRGLRSDIAKRQNRSIQ